MSKLTLKLKKQKKRERDNKRKKLFEANKRMDFKRRRDYWLNYPEIRFDATNGDPGFVKLVKKALATINFEDRNVFEEWEAELYRTLKQHGTSAVRNILRSLKQNCYEDGIQNGRLAEIHFALNLGQTVLNRIPEVEREKYLPINNMDIVFRGNHILVIFHSLLKAKGAGGTTYYSRLKPTLEVDGKPKVVGFSMHAIKQICERIKPRWKSSFAALGDVYAFLERCMYFEYSQLYEGQLAFTFFDECYEDFIQYWYVQDVLGEENLDRKVGRPYYRVGYCPAVIEGEFIKAKTLLFPGFTATPEYSALLNARLPYSEKQEMIQKAKHQNAMALYESQDFSLIKWFHDHGVPQVKLLDHHVYASTA